jgi:hypothetical protein
MSQTFISSVYSHCQRRYLASVLLLLMSSFAGSLRPTPPSGDSNVELLHYFEAWEDDSVGAHSISTGSDIDFLS